MHFSGATNGEQGEDWEKAGSIHGMLLGLRDASIHTHPAGR